MIGDQERYLNGGNEFETNENGQIEVGNLVIGETYYIKEEKSPKGFLLPDSNSQIHGKNYHVKIEITNATEKAINIENANIKKDITATKKWEGGKNIPVDTKLQLYRDGSVYGDPVVISNKDYPTKEVTWKNLNETDNSGKEYTYTVDEIVVPENYTLTKTDGDLTFVNTYKSPTLSITAEKEWVGGPDTKPTIELQLYKNIKNGSKVAVEGPVKLESGSTKHTWKNLDKTDSDGNDYVYTVDEVSTPYSYYKSISKDGLKITNTFYNPTTSVIGKKVWVGGPELKPDITLQLMRDGEAFKDPVTLKDGKDYHIWTGLDDTSGHKYTVEEVNVPKDYKATYSEDGRTVTNTYVIPKTNITASKIWLGGPEIKPTIQLQLYRNNEAYLDPVTLVDGSLEFTWKNLDHTDIDGNIYTYRVDEVEIPQDYDLFISEDGLTLTNVHYSTGGEYDPNDPNGSRDPQSKPKPPSTGINNNQLFYVTTITLASFSLVGLRKKRRLDSN